MVVPEEGTSSGSSFECAPGVATSIGVSDLMRYVGACPGMVSNRKRIPLASRGVSESIVPNKAITSRWRLSGLSGPRKCVLTSCTGTKPRYVIAPHLPFLVSRHYSLRCSSPRQRGLFSDRCRIENIDFDSPRQRGHLSTKDYIHISLFTRRDWCSRFSSIQTSYERRERR